MHAQFLREGSTPYIYFMAFKRPFSALGDYMRGDDLHGREVGTVA